MSLCLRERVDLVLAILRQAFSTKGQRIKGIFNRQEQSLRDLTISSFTSFITSRLPAYNQLPTTPTKIIPSSPTVPASMLGQPPSDDRESCPAVPTSRNEETDDFQVAFRRLGLSPGNQTYHDIIRQEKLDEKHQMFMDGM